VVIGMKYNSVFDIIGPVMIGPSSSHTAGAARIGKAARNLLGEEPTWAKIHLYESFAKTYKGHGTDFALVGGLLGFETDDPRMSKALDIAKERNFDIEFIEDTAAVNHPNTVRLIIGSDTNQIELVGISIGGGKVEITELNGFVLRLSGNHPALLVMHNDRFGAIASVTSILAKHEINIGHMEVNRKDVGDEALMVIEVDQNIKETVMHELQKAAHITNICTIVS
jgi:L-serine dehydratase